MSASNVRGLLNLRRRTRDGWALPAASMQIGGRWRRARRWYYAWATSAAGSQPRARIASTILGIIAPGIARLPANRPGSVESDPRTVAALAIRRPRSIRRPRLPLLSKTLVPLLISMEVSYFPDFSEDHRSTEHPVPISDRVSDQECRL